MKRVIFTIALALGSLAVPATTTLAQEIRELGKEEMLDRWSQQRTRGLLIAPAEGGPPAAQLEAGATIGYEPVAEEMAVNVSIAFDFDSAALRADQRPKLVTLCEAMRESDIPLFQIVGHTDATGSAEYNERLSLLRAEEVKRHLVSDCGIALDRLQAVGMGMRYPYDPANPRDGVNRRVEIQAVS